MTKRRVLVIGSTGMLGGAVCRTLANKDLEVLEASRSRGLLFNAEVDSAEALLESAGLKPGDFVLNCVGLTKAHIKDETPRTLERALRLNVLFPLAIARSAEKLDLRVIQVATDCVFSGRKGKYSESNPHDAYDLYGKTKSLGEIKSNHVMHLRCSLVGPEGNGRQSLFFEWVRAAALNARLQGFVNHQWNGLTSLAFARIVAGVIESGNFMSGIHHLVPADEITKYELIQLELELLGRQDVRLQAVEAEESINRTLTTDSKETNSLLFACGGYEREPTIREMMEELPWEAFVES